MNDVEDGTKSTLNQHLWCVSELTSFEVNMNAMRAIFHRPKQARSDAFQGPFKPGLFFESTSHDMPDFCQKA